MISKAIYNYPKHSIYVFFLLLIPLCSLGLEPVGTLFERGNEQYASAHYKEAALSYHKIIDEGYLSSSLYFNLGNAYYKLGDIASALLYYEKAHKLAPGDEDIKMNIQLANLKTVDKIEEVPTFFLSNWWTAFLLFFSIKTLALFGIVFCILAFSILAIFLFVSTMRIKKLLFYSAMVLLFFGILSVFAANRQMHYFASHHEAIVFEGAVTVKSEPDDASKDLFVIHKGTKVSIVDEVGNWMKIELPNGKVGWMVSADARDI